MKNIRVMQLIPSLGFGGVERGAVDLAIFLKSQEIENSIVSTRGYLAVELEKSSLPHIAFQCESKNPLTFYKRIRLLRTILMVERPSVLHARSRIPAWLAYFANKSICLPFVTTCHGLHDNGFLGLKRFYNASLTKGDCIIAVSETVKNYLIKNFPKAKDKIVVIHRGIDCNYFYPKNRLNQNSVFSILLPGRLTRLKGHVYCLKSLSIVINRFKLNAILLISGNAKSKRYLNQLKKLCADLNLTDYVQFLPATNDMPTLYSEADLVVSSSIEPESFGRVAVEAMAMEKMVIATNIGGSKETIIHGETGWLVEPNDVNAMAAAIYHAFKLSPEAREAMGKRARAHVLRHFSIDQMMEKTLAVYQNQCYKNSSGC